MADTFSMSKNGNVPALCFDVCDHAGRTTGNDQINVILQLEEICYIVTGGDLKGWEKKKKKNNIMLSNERVGFTYLLNAW